jgi:hypothetical protein
MKRFLRKLLGVDDLESKVEYLEKHVSVQDKALIKAAKEKELLREASKSSSFSDEAREYFKNEGIDTTLDETRSMVAVNAAEAVERYQFAKFDPEIRERIDSPIISMKEFAEHPEKYIHKTEKGVFSFPLALNEKNVTELFKGYGNKGISCLSTDLSFTALEQGIARKDLPSSEMAETTLYNALVLSRVNSKFSDKFIEMDPFDFLTNYDGLVSYVKESSLTQEEKVSTLEALALTKAVHITAFDISFNSQILPTEDLLTYEEPDEEAYQTVIARTDSGLYEKIRNMLLSDMPGTKESDLNELLPVRSIERFRELASKKTAEIVSNDAKTNGMTSFLQKDITEYTPAESIMMACYFARNVITQYEKLEDAVDNIFQGKTTEGITGKCSDYAGLALHYLNEYLVPLNPERYKHWTFGVETDRIGNNYNHVFIKAIHENPNGSHDVFFIDPTSLSSISKSALKTPKDIATYASTESHPVQIIRDAEDFLY